MNGKYIDFGASTTKNWASWTATSRLTRMQRQQMSRKMIRKQQMSKMCIKKRRLHGYIYIEGLLKDLRAQKLLRPWKISNPHRQLIHLSSIYILQTPQLLSALWRCWERAQERWTAHRCLLWSDREASEIGALGHGAVWLICMTFEEQIDVFSAGSMALWGACSVELKRSKDMFQILKMTRIGLGCER